MISIGPVSLDNPFVLAPMAGIGDPPFRRLCRKAGAGMVSAEMVSSNALHFEDERSRRMLRVYPDEHPVSLQVFGSDPARLAEAARKVEDAGADIVDLNCGCPVPKITKSGAGMSLMREESLFAACVEAMARAVRIPVTVKMRLGFRAGDVRSPRFARLARESGAAAVSVHARSMEDRHDGPPRLEALRETVEAAGIPVLGNGGVEDYAGVRRMMRETGCAAVLIGQAAVGNPLIFLELLAEQEKEQGAGAAGKKPSLTGRFDVMRRHLDLIVEYYGEDLGVRRFRKYLPAYVKGLPGAAEFRASACRLSRADVLREALQNFEASLRPEAGVC